MRQDISILDGHSIVETLTDPAFGRMGFLVIDTYDRGSSVGGVRILPDVYLEEISHMARTMTRKYLFTGIRKGGAKAGLIMKGRAKSDRRGALLAFGRALKPFIDGGYYPGEDMGSSAEDIRTILEGAGRVSFKSRPSDSGRYTAWSVFSSIEAVLERSSIGLGGCRLSIEGFGKVGSALAGIAARNGCRIVCVSNIHGAIYDPKGLDVERMLRLKEEHGDRFIDHYEGAERWPRGKVFSADCDVFVPCARSWSINSSNMDSIKAKGIVTGANVPMTSEHERYLWERGKTIVPDAIANCGGVLGLTLERVMDEQGMKAVFDGRFKERVHEVLDEEMAPSDYLDAFCRRRKEELGDELERREISWLDRIRNHAGYHLLDPMFGRSRIERELFPR